MLKGVIVQGLIKMKNKLNFFIFIIYTAYIYLCIFTLHYITLHLIATEETHASLAAAVSTPGSDGRLGHL
jgi:hypothetical protein